MISTFSSTSPPTYAADLARAALAGALLGQRVAVLVASPREKLDVEHALHEQLAPVDVAPETTFSDRFGYRGAVHLVWEGASIRTVTYDAELAGASYDLVVVGEGVYPPLQEEARKRLRSSGGEA